MTDFNINIARQDIEVLPSAKSYSERLLSLISQAKQRIYITALYLENDEAGREVLDALYQAKQQAPQLDICLFVDAHRAQRGLIGQAVSLGNRQMYIDLAAKHQQQISIYGVAVKRKELLGVLHLKGMVFDDHVLYTGASINNIYMHHKDKYRLDRYYQIHSAPLADTMVQYLTDSFVKSGLAMVLNTPESLSIKQQKRIGRSTTIQVKKARYIVDKASANQGMQILPLIGCGKRNNQLNQTICQLLKQSQHQVIIFTPYFNLPRGLIKQVIAALKRGVKITLVVGDKTASDFFIKPDDTFSFIGVIPYIYEQILRRFVKRWQSYINQGQLSVKLWHDGDNSYHAKGVIVDERYHLITGSNLNPRAWSLDLENGLLIDDPEQSLLTTFNDEYQAILANTKPLMHYSQLESLKDYPIQPRKQLRRLSLAKIDRLLKRFL
ncbi:CDP-diacylglycerol--serine O-phosphatidyltransferase [Thalassotalea sp. G2M2-11]|uniref:CDP-diacylglycerol--serine O-phosphatidyltransferase n=1 Tax=Thalassotalea sp. G2M2-11 TaxID=2787627 RepID=UPI0019D2A0F6|nr:CDP-diacylglycerol--serine O-phosphatidyltransferase [Thalassotalea sp. G2M2-11]